MNWHIITSSKGGVGKTLVSLMLLGSSCDAYLKKENNSYVLAFDLNGMNADLRRMVATRNPIEANRLTSKNQDFHFEINRGRQYIVGWPQNSFKILTPESFFALISKIEKSLKEELQQQFRCDIQTVIIDTSYHFCNLFSQEVLSSENAEQFALFSREDEQLFIWFIWVYRQLANLFDFFEYEQANNPYDVDARDVQDVGLAIDNSSLGKKRSPFVHVFSPNSVGQVSSGIMAQLFGQGNPLRRLVELKKRQPCRFADFIGMRLRNAKNQTNRLPTDDVQQHFVKILHKYVDIITREGIGPGCPRNVVPVLFQQELLGYTESEKQDLFNKIIGLDVYKSFQESYEALLS